MDALNTAEGATRFLRAKGGSLDKIVLTANKILEDTIDVHLPNRHIFIFDLLCDRLNDNNHFKNWKYDSQCWVLFKKVWISLNDDKIARNRSMKKLKFIDILVHILNNPEQQKDKELLNDMMKTISIVMNEFYIEIEDTSSINLLASYVKTLNYLHDKIGINDNIINNWTNIIYKLYQIPQLNVNHKYNKKSITKFFNEFIPPALYFINATQDQSEFTETKLTLQNILCKVMFNKDSISSLKGNINTLLSKSAGDISFESLKYLFVLVINNLSSKDMKLCEELFISIINTKKFNQMSETLLEILSNVNKSLSTEFFTSIYEKEVKSNSSNDINWSLVIHLFNLDIELAMNNAEEILLNIPNSVANETKIKVGESVADAYIKAREFVEFFQNIWLKVIHKSPIWKSSEFVDIMSTKVNNLSTNQLNAVLSSLFDQKDALPLIISIVKGLITCPLPKVGAVKRLILSQSNLFTEKAKCFWEIRFYVLCLYNEDVLENNPEFVSFVSNSSPCFSEFYHYTIFRLIEISGEDGSFGEYQSVFNKYLKNLEPNVLQRVLMDVLNRWLVVIDKFFTKDQIVDILGFSFQSLDFETVIQNYFYYNGDIFFEQKNLTDTLLAYLIENLKNGKDENSLSFVNLVSTIPVQCFDKYSKKKLMEILFESFSGYKTIDVNVAVRVALKHLLIQPSFKSSIELDFKLTLNLMKTSVKPSTHLSNEIVQSIWNQHLLRFNVDANKNYILESIKYLNNFFKSFKSKKIMNISPEFQASLIIILTNSKYTYTSDILKEMTQTLIDRFTVTIKSQLVKIIEDNEIDYDIVSWLLNSLYLILNEYSDQAEGTFVLIKTMGQRLSSQNNQINKVRIILFKLLTNVSKPSFKNAIFISSLFISLDISFGSGMDNEMVTALMSYLSRFSANEEEFKMLYYFVLHSVNAEEDSKNMTSLVRIMNCLIRSLNKEYQIESTTLFIRSLSVFLTQYKLISLSGNSSVLSILSTLKSSLSDMTWCFNQYALESTISLMTRISRSFKDQEFIRTDDAVETYIQLTQVASSILLFHRFKLSSRHHVIISLFVSLLEPLSLRKHQSEDDGFSTSIRAASAYSRLLCNLCEPSNTSSKEMVQSSLNSTSALIKRSLRKHLPILLLNYIYIALKYNFKSQVNDELMSGIFSVFNVLSQTELRLVSSSLDITGKTYYRTLYADYKEHGKWKDE